MPPPPPMPPAPVEEPPPPPPRPTAAPGGVLDEANRLLESGDVPSALDSLRAIVDRQPEQVEPVIARLTGLLQDTRYRAHYEEVRLLLVDAYMVQGDYDRAMSLLHEPAG
jgi:ATP/maltotriose-dependent transcriptional regulator MalT